MSRKQQQPLVIRDHQADMPEGLDLEAARERELADSITRALQSRRTDGGGRAAESTADTSRQTA